MKRLLTLLLCALLMTGCAAQPTQAADIQQTSGNGFFFDTWISVILYGADDTVLDEIWAACDYYENMLSRTVENSDVSRINRSNGRMVRVSEDTWNILREAKEISAMTDGAFSVTIAPISAMWDFTDGTKKMPTDEERIAALSLVDDQKIVLGQNNTVILPVGMKVDLGGIAKGYIADRIAEMLTGRVYGAIISLGGNVYVSGDKPNGQPNIIGIRDPWGGMNDIMGRVFTKNTSVVTSGTYERFFEKDGVTYHHILDPKTGSSAVSDLVSATFVMPNSMAADALATACIVKGLDWSLQFAEEHGLDAIFITRDGETYLSKSFADHHTYDPYQK